MDATIYMYICGNSPTSLQKEFNELIDRFEAGKTQLDCLYLAPRLLNINIHNRLLKDCLTYAMTT